jgi:hypothetical protein
MVGPVSDFAFNVILRRYNKAEAELMRTAQLMAAGEKRLRRAESAAGAHTSTSQLNLSRF